MNTNGQHAAEGEERAASNGHSEIPKPPRGPNKYNRCENIGDCLNQLKSRPQSSGPASGWPSRKINPGPDENDALLIEGCNDEPEVHDLANNSFIARCLASVRTVVAEGPLAQRAHDLLNIPFEANKHKLAALDPKIVRTVKRIPFGMPLLEAGFLVALIFAAGAIELLNLAVWALPQTQNRDAALRFAAPIVLAAFMPHFAARNFSDEQRRRMGKWLLGGGILSVLVFAIAFGLRFPLARPPFLNALKVMLLAGQSMIIFCFNALAIERLAGLFEVKIICEDNPEVIQRLADSALLLTEMDPLSRVVAEAALTQQEYEANGKLHALAFLNVFRALREQQAATRARLNKIIKSTKSTR